MLHRSHIARKYTVGEKGKTGCISQGTLGKQSQQNLPMYLSVCLSVIYVSMHLSLYVSIYLSFTYLLFICLYI